MCPRSARGRSSQGKLPSGGVWDQSRESAGGHSKLLHRMKQSREKNVVQCVQAQC